MIEGLHFDLSHDELKDHLEHKASFHCDRQAWYQERVKDLRAGDTDLEDQQISGGNPIQNLENQIKKHGGRADLFQFLADHLVNETYRLSESDLKELEFIGRYF